MVTRRRRFSAIRILLATIHRDLLIHCRRPADILNPLMFFLMVVSLFPLGIGASPAVLTEIAAGVIWVAVLLSTLLSIDVMFKGDFDDGSIEQIVLGRHPPDPGHFRQVHCTVVGQWIANDHHEPGFRLDVSLE